MGFGLDSYGLLRFSPLILGMLGFIVPVVGWLLGLCLTVFLFLLLIRGLVVLFFGCDSSWAQRSF